MLEAAQRETLKQCIIVVILASVTTDGFGNPIKAWREVSQLNQFLKNRYIEYNEYPLLREVLFTFDLNGSLDEPTEVKGPPSLEQVMEALAGADAVFEEKADAQAFRSFLYQLAMTIVNAHGGISERERELLDMLKLQGKHKDKEV